MLTRFKKRFLDLPISQKFVSVFAVMTLFNCALMTAAQGWPMHWTAPPAALYCCRPKVPA